MIVYAVETYDQIIEDIRPLLPAHWEETATYRDIPLDPNYEFYRRGNIGGLLGIYSARLDGALIGYAVIVQVPRHSQYDHKWATSNLFWIHPDHRNMKVGRGLVSFIKENLVGYVLQIVSSVDHPELGVLLTSEGFSPVEVVHSIRL